MKSKNAIIFGVAIICGLVASYMVAQTLKGPEISLLVATQPIPRYAAVRDLETSFELRKVRREELPQGFRNAASLEQLRERAVDHFLEKAMNPGEPLSLDYLDKRSGPDVRKGCLAAAVNVTAATGAGGFIQPGNFVQIFGLKRLPNGDKKVVVLMKKVRVLLVDQMTSRAPDMVARVASTITLEVTTEEAKKLKLAQEDGLLSLAKMSFRDADPDDSAWGGSELTVREIDERKGEVEEAQPEMVSVLTARILIAEGTALKDCVESLELRQLPRNQLTGNAVTTFEQLQSLPKDLFLSRSLKAGESLSLEHVAARDKRKPQTLVIVGNITTQRWTWDEDLEMYIQQELPAKAKK